MGVEYLVAGALITCPLGTQQEQILLIPDDHGTYVGGKLVAREIDCEPIKNIPPFGICTFTQKPCVANFVGYRWLNTQEDSYVGGGSEAATTDSFLLCSIGETIVYPSDSGQDPVEVGSILKMLQELIELMQNCPEYFSFENIDSLVLGLGLALFDAGLSDVNGELYALEAAIGQLANAFGDNSRLLDQAWKEFCRHDSTTKSFMERQIENSKNPEAAAFGKFLGSSLLGIAGALGTAKGVMDIILGGGLTVGSIGGSISSGGTAVAFLIPVLTAAGELAAVGVAEVSVGVHAAAGGFANVGDDWERLQAIRREKSSGENSKFKWGNPKSKPTYGHTFSEHGQKQTPVQLKDRSRSLDHQVGQWLDDQKAAEFLESVAKNGEGVYHVKLPSDVNGRSFLPDGTEVVSDMAVVVVKSDGSIRTAYPYNSSNN